MKKKAVLVTGFEPYGGHGRNPSAEIAASLDGRRIGGVPVVGQLLPVDIERLDKALSAALRDVDPVAVVLLGLAPGEAVIRLERVALNVADFAIADNAGRRMADQPLDPRGGAGLWSRLPLRAIQERLLKRGIPARLSETAGLYLCNASLYRALRRLPVRIPCGFIHLPLLPEQIAEKIATAPDAAIAPSMPFRLQKRAIELALEVVLAESRQARSRRSTVSARSRRTRTAKA